MEASSVLSQEKVTVWRDVLSVMWFRTVEFVALSLGLCPLFGTCRAGGPEGGLLHRVVSRW